MSLAFRNRFSTKLTLLIAIVFLIPVITTIVMLAMSSRQGIRQFDALLTEGAQEQSDGLTRILPEAANSENPGEIIGLLKDYEKRRSLGLMTGLTVTAFVLAAVVILLSLLVLKRGMVSLKELSAVSVQVGEGNFDISPVSRSHDEFSQLTEAFRTMTRRLRETVVLRDFFNQVVESMPAAVFTVDREGLITTWNRQAVKLTGLSARETIMHRADTVADVIGRIPDISELPYFGRELVVRPRGRAQRVVSKGADLFYDRAGEPAGVIATFVDITGLKEMERELIFAKERAEESSRLRSEFLANMSHEIRTPLNGILGLADVLMDNERDEEQRESLATIRQCGENLLHLINEILDLSKIEAGKMMIHPSVAAMQDMVRESIKTIEVGCQKKSIELSTEMAQGVPEVLEVDRRKVVQILVNLLGNALKFTEKGSIVLRVAPYSGERRGTIIFSVSDTGIGIPSDRRDHIFESFAQAEAHLTRTGDGTGLGLAISKKLVELMGGDIWIESIEGNGSTFNFTITVENTGEG